MHNHCSCEAHAHLHHHHHHKLSNTNEKKTLAVIIFTLITMAAEIFFGYVSHSMALLADGFHMGTHALALSIAYGAYIFIRKIQNKKHHEEVSEKASSLAGFTSSLFLMLTGFWLIFESFERLISPLKISFNEAILVAVIGLFVNLICIFIMENKETKETDYNYKAAYLHILADAMTSVFAIIALFLGKYFGLVFLDPVMGFVGAFLILKWSFGLIKNTGYILLDLKLLKE